MRQRHHHILAWVIPLVTTIGCVAEQGDIGTEGESASTAALRLGASGPEVHAVRDRLTQLGYFPNAELAEQYPNWLPVVPVTSADPDLFDSNLELAVRKFQINYQLEPNGTVDDATNDALAEQRCGNPDSDPTLDPTNKFDILGAIKWNKVNVKYQFTTGVTSDQKAAFAAAANTWVASSRRTFELITAGVPDITVGFCSTATPTPPNLLACNWAPGTLLSNTFPDYDQNFIYEANILLDTAIPAASRVGVMAHAIGHALGLGHSSVTRTLMWPVTGPDQTSAPALLDDEVAARCLYSGLTQLPGGAIDIGIGGGTQSTWIIGQDTDGAGNGGIYWWDPAISNWRKTNYGAAKRIAVDDTGRSWIVNAGGQIFRFVKANNSWESLPGEATDIGVSGTNTAWMIGRASVGTAGDKSIHRWTESTRTWSTVSGGAVRIAVDNAGRPWVINAAGSIFRWNASNSTWDSMPGGGTDIGTNKGVVFLVGGDNLAGGNHSWFVWDYQPLGTVGNPVARNIGNWVKVQGSAKYVAANSEGRAWVVDAAGSIFKQK